jgi:chemotaxis protein MotD
MTNAGAVSQPPVAAGELVGGRTQGAGRKGARGEEGGFEGLLSSLAAGRRDGPSADAPASGEMPSPDSRMRQAAGWFGGSEAIEGEAEGQMPVAELVDAIAGEQAGTGDAPAGNDGAMLGAPEAGDPAGAILGQGAGGNGVPITAGGAPLPVAAVAIGLAADAPAAALPDAPPDGGMRTPLRSDAVLARPSRGMEMGGGPSGKETVEVEVTVAVLRRETHLPPVRQAAVAAERMPGPPQPRAGSQTEQTAVQAPAGGGSGGVAVPSAAAPAAVAAAPGSDSGAHLRQGREPFAGRQSADARADVADAAPLSTSSEEGIPVARSEANAGSTPAPTPAATPVQQIASRIAAEAAASNGAGRPEAAGFPPQAQPSSPVKVLHIQLQPADLGTVTVRISLKDQTLRVDLEVGRGETAQLIQREREALSSLLRSAGYLVDGLDVRVTDLSAQGQQVAGGQSGMQMPGGGQAGSSQADGRPQGARPQDQRRGNPSAGESNGENEQAGHPARRSDIYV